MPCLSPAFGSQLWSCRPPEKSFLGRGLHCGCQQHRAHPAPTVCPHSRPGLLFGKHPLELLPGVEVMAATLHWPNHVFGEGAAKDLAQAFSLLFGGRRGRGTHCPNEQCPAPTQGRVQGGCCRCKGCRTGPWGLPFWVLFRVWPSLKPPPLPVTLHLATVAFSWLIKRKHIWCFGGLKTFKTLTYF